MPKLTIIIGSTRPGRAGLAIGEWFAKEAREHGGFDVSVVDLAELDLPIFNEANHPRLQQYEHQHTKGWSKIVGESDAFVVVTPEYNHSFPASLKNAVDYLHNEWNYKPLGYVSYGGVAAGTRAVQALKPVFDALRVTNVVEAVNIPFHPQFIDEEGAVQPNEVMQQAAPAMLDELVRVEAALRPLRTPVAAG